MPQFITTVEAYQAPSDVDGVEEFISWLEQAGIGYELDGDTAWFYGRELAALPGDWVVLWDSQVTIYDDKAFNRLFKPSPIDAINEGCAAYLSINKVGIGLGNWAFIEAMKDALLKAAEVFEDAGTNSSAGGEGG